MKKFLLLFAVTAFSFSALFSQALYEENFDSYEPGDYMAVVNPDWWSTWSGSPGSAEDAVVSDEQSSSPSNSIKIDGTIDAILLLGNKTAGKYDLSFKYYIPSGFGGYFNVQHFESPGVEWAYEVYFGATGSGYLDAGSAQVAGFDFDHDTWIDIQNIIDLDNDNTQLYINGTMVYEWPFSWQSTSQSGTLQLGGVDVFAGAPTGETPTFYMDDLSFSAVASPLYSEDYESYEVGDYVAVVNPDWWTTWSNDPGSAEDALITDAQANSPTQSAIVDGTTDLILKLGDQTSGKFEVTFYVYVPEGYGGYYNFQHFESPGVEWAFEVYFGATGAGYLNAGATQVAGFDFDHDTWIYCDQIMDLDNDLAQLYINDELIYEWPFSYQASTTSGTLQLGGIDFFAGAPTGEDPTYYIDDLEVIQLVAPQGGAVINLTPTVLIQNLTVGNTGSDMITISNTGEDPLDFSVVVTYPPNGKSATGNTTSPPTIKHSDVVLTNTPAVAPAIKPGGTLEPTDDVVLQYDNDDITNAIGYQTTSGILKACANFSSDLVSEYIGMELSSITVYINDMPAAAAIQVYDYGTTALPGPGEMMYEQAWSPTMADWNTINLDEPVVVSGGDFWVGYQVDIDAGTFPAGCDSGPHHPQGDWTSSGVGWHHLSDNPDLDYNWHIRATLTGDAIVQWLSADPMSGTVDPGGSMDVDITFDATELEGGNSYYGELVFNNNDPDNPQVIVPVNLGVLPGINEYSKAAVAVYPNPATHFINIKGDHEIYSVELLNLMGQQVYRSEVNQMTHTINTDNFDSGVYLIKVELANGVITQRVTVN